MKADLIEIEFLLSLVAIWKLNEMILKNIFVFGCVLMLAGIIAADQSTESTSDFDYIGEFKILISKMLR